MSDVDMMRLEEAVLFICSTCREEDRLGAVKLNKILYYSDMLHFAKTGSSITGATYVKQQRGPVPKEVVEAINRLKAAGRLNTHEISIFDKTRREFEALDEPDFKIFTHPQLQLIQNMISTVCGYDAQEISDISHTVVWEVADLGEELPYASFLVSFLGDVDEDDVSLAQQIIADHERAKHPDA
jgi:uncharacterized phage-associated protein